MAYVERAMMAEFKEFFPLGKTVDGTSAVQILAKLATWAKNHSAREPASPFE
jgi:hypothetical protein